MDTLDLLTVVLSILTLCAIFYLVPYLSKYFSKKGIDVGKLLDSSDQVLQIIETVVSSLNLQGQAKTFVSLIIDSAQMGVKYAEQLYKSGQIEAEQRKFEAVNFVRMVLADQNIEIDDEREKLIVAVVEAAVFLLPPTNPVNAE